MDLETVIAFLLGLVAGFLTMAPFVSMVTRKARRDRERERETFELELAELRQERADDRETNRRLRRELALKTPTNYETVVDERDRALAELEAAYTDVRSLRARAAELEGGLAEVNAELADRDRSLREARLAIQEIRLQLEDGRLLVGESAEADLGAGGLHGEVDGTRADGPDDRTFEGSSIGESTPS